MGNLADGDIQELFEQKEIGQSMKIKERVRKSDGEEIREYETDDPGEAADIMGGIKSDEVGSELYDVELMD